ncbi:efflux RND transporter permease subunit, partial [Arthrospira platensis SPKY1]|nr:efflux RND transporter permease subunit [Arthrospira platensis SPKY1]
TDLQSVQQFADVTIRNINGLPIRIGDVARVELGPQDERTSVRLNGRDTVSLGVIRQATANPLDLSASVRSLLEKVREDLPASVTIDIASDNSVFIDRSIKAVYVTIIEAVVLVTLVIVIFLRTARASIIPLIAIPVSLIGAFA